MMTSASESSFLRHYLYSFILTVLATSIFAEATTRRTPLKKIQGLPPGFAYFHGEHERDHKHIQNCERVGSTPATDLVLLMHQSHQGTTHLRRSTTTPTETHLTDAVETGVFESDALNIWSPQGLQRHPEPISISM